MIHTDAGRTSSRIISDWPDQFSPIPEAKALEWSDLFPSTREALWQLLHHLHAAVETSAEEHEHELLSTSFLINGDRGFGKTTLLFTAANAIQEGARYFKEPDGGDPDPRIAEKRRQLRQLVDDHLHRRVLWLTPLDLEPIPKTANLLAEVLVRIQEALDNQVNGPGRRRASTSLLGGDLEDTGGKLDKLTSDATFMWEEVSAFGGTQRREHAELQIKAADIFARFQQRFKEAVESVAAAVQPYVRSPEKPVLVLPVDNVDRSVEHIYSIMKLARIASSPQLWFVLAAGLPEFQFFLECSFQQELVARQEQLSAAEQDRIASIARRQAATTMLRSLPRRHQVRIDPVGAMEAWRGASGREKGLRSLLEKIPLPRRSVASGRAGALSNFRHLFDAELQLTGEVSTHYRQARDEKEGASGRMESAEDEEKSVLTHAARMALMSLSARRLRDLKRSIEAEAGEREPPRPSEQAFTEQESVEQESVEQESAEWEPDEPEPGHQRMVEWESTFRRTVEVERKLLPQPQPAREDKAPGKGAVSIAVDMLKTAIDESNLPYWASDQLHNHVIRQDMHAQWILDLRRRPLCQLKETHPLYTMEFGHSSDGLAGGARMPACDVLSDVQLRQFDDIVLELRSPSRRKNRAPLPADVAGWYMIFHDLLVSFRSPRVMSRGGTLREMSPGLMVTRHELPVGTELVVLKFWWRPPEWDTFFDLSIFTLQWKAFLHRASPFLRSGGIIKEDDPGLDAAQRFQLARAAWIDNVCSVASPSHGRWDWGEAEGLEKLLSRVEGFESRLDRYVDLVDRRVKRLEAELEGELSQSPNGKPLADQRRCEQSLEWLRGSLPLLQQPEYDPVRSGRLPAVDRPWGRASRPEHVMVHRRQLVREAARRLCAGGRGRGRSWLESVVTAWFGQFDGAENQQASGSALR